MGDAAPTPEDINKENPLPAQTPEECTKSVESSPEEPPEKIRNQEAPSTSTGPPVNFTLVFGHNKHQVAFPLNATVEEFRVKVEELTGVPPVMQKLISKGPAMKNGTTLAENKIKEGCRVMLIGSTLNQVIQVNNIPSADEIKKSSDKASSSSREPLSKQKPHAKTIDKGLPSDALPGIKNAKENFPLEPLTGMRNKYNQKTRLTFKLETDELWIGTPGLFWQ